MCKQQPGTHPQRVVLRRCSHHTFHLTVGDVTLHLDQQELGMIAAAVQKWLGRHPDILKTLDEAGMIDVEQDEQT